VYRRYTLYPAEAHEWARRQSIPHPPEAYSPLCPGGDEEGAAHGDGSEAEIQGQTGDSRSGSLHLLLMTSPDQGSRYRLSSEIPLEMQQVAVKARPADGVAVRHVTLLIDGQPLAMLSHPPYSALWPMTPGRHVFAVAGVDGQGNELKGNSVSIEVVQ